jgi:RNA polymerase sigma-70 factor (ECF subfamily)
VSDAATGSRERDDEVVAAARAGDERAFAAVVERHRRELRVHCYRMTGSLEEAEDLVQETFLRAWKNLAGFEGRSTLRAWLYRIATNACLDALDGRARRLLPQHLTPPLVGSLDQPPRTDIAWLQPIPDRLWEPAAPGDQEPDAVAVSRETIELAFLAAIQHLAPRPRAVLILRDVLGWSARQTAEQLDATVASVNSHLARARGVLREQLPERHRDWTPSSGPSAEERAVLDRYMAAVEAGDLAAVAALLADDVRASMPPWPQWFLGRDAVVGALTESWDPTSPSYVGRFRLEHTAANGQLAVAGYVRGHGDDEHRAFAVSVVTIAGGRLQEMVAFHDPAVFAAFDLPPTLPARS